MEALVDGVIESTPLRLEGIYNEVLRVNRLVGDLTQLTKYEFKSVRLSKTRFNLSDRISSIVVSLESLCQNKNITIKINCSIKEFFGDQDKISQIIINLLSNSIKYSKYSGNIYLKAFEQGKSIVISVSDDGTGISDEDLPYVFERFYRVDKSRNKETGGSGIGLTIVKEIVEAHGGGIIIKSSLGKGTEAIITFPKQRVKK